MREEEEENRTLQVQEEEVYAAVFCRYCCVLIITVVVVIIALHPVRCGANLTTIVTLSSCSSHTGKKAKDGQLNQRRERVAEQVQGIPVCWHPGASRAIVTATATATAATTVGVGVLVDAMAAPLPVAVRGSREAIDPRRRGRV